jgi:hypothetical protein
MAARPEVADRSRHPNPAKIHRPWVWSRQTRFSDGTVDFCEYLMLCLFYHMAPFSPITRVLRRGAWPLPEGRWPVPTPSDRSAGRELGSLRTFYPPRDSAGLPAALNWVCLAPLHPVAGWGRAKLGSFRTFGPRPLLPELRPTRRSRELGLFRVFQPPGDLTLSKSGQFGFVLHNWLRLRTGPTGAGNWLCCRNGTGQRGVVARMSPRAAACSVLAQSGPRRNWLCFAQVVCMFNSP